jgi:excisionase family DNA binding protein
MALKDVLLSTLLQPSGDWLTLPELARLLKTRESHLRGLVAAGQIPYSKLGRLIRFHRPTIEQWLLERREVVRHDPGGANEFKEPTVEGERST